MSTATQAPAPGAVARLSARLDAVGSLIGALSAWLTLGLVLLVAANVLLRYLFRVGSVWSQELEWHLLVPIALFGSVYAMRAREHVQVDIVYERLSESGRRFIDLLAALVTIVVSVLLIKYSLPYVGQSYRILEGSPDPGGLPARYVLKALIPVGFALLALQGLADLLRQVVYFMGQERPDTPDPA